MEKLKEYLRDQNFAATESESKYKLEAKCTVHDDQTVISAKVGKVTEEVNCVRLKMVVGNKMDFFEIFREVKDYLAEAKMIL